MPATGCGHERRNANRSFAGRNQRKHADGTAGSAAANLAAAGERAAGRHGLLDDAADFRRVALAETDRRPAAGERTETG